MTPKQREFVREYTIDLNATQAAIRAGYSNRTATKIAAENLRKPDIAAAIDAAMAERARRTEVTADRVVEELARLAFLDIGEAFDANGAMKPLADMPPDLVRAIAGFEASEILDPDGRPIGRLKRVKLADKLGALQLLMRHLGMLNDKVRVQGDAENPLAMLIKRVQGTALPVVADPDADDEDAPRRRLM